MAKGTRAAFLLVRVPPAHPHPRAAPTSPWSLTVVGAIVGVADTEVAPTILHAVATVWALRVHVAWCRGDFCKHMARASLLQSVARGHPHGNRSLLALQGSMRQDRSSGTDSENGNAQTGCSVSFTKGVQKGCNSLPTHGSWAEAKAGRGTAQRGSDGGGSIAISPGDKFPVCTRHCAVPGSGMGNVSLLTHKLPDSSIPEGMNTVGKKLSPTKFTEETKKPRKALADGDIPLQTTASITTLTALRELCKRGNRSFPGPLLLVGWERQAALPDATHRGSSGEQEP